MLQELQRLTVRRSVPVEGIEIAARGDMARKPFVNGAFWAEDGEWFDFFATVTVPDDFAGRAVLRVRTGREAEWEAINPQFVVRVDGEIVQAFDTKHTTLLLPGGPGRTFALELNGYAKPSEPEQTLPVFMLTLEDVDEATQQLVYDIDVPYHAAIQLAAGDRDREVTLETLARALDLLDLRAPHSDAYAASVAHAREYLRTEYYAKRAPLEPIAYADCVGHTHIDVAWLWDLEQTRHKAVRSFSTVLQLMDRYPEYLFMSSQPALYDMVKTDEPALYARIKEAVASGRWEVEGGMWVEADCNLASGEALVRQFLYGQAFFEQEFGKRSRILWLPDVFGYSAALPQIMRLAGIDYFMTTKLSWSEYNLSPYDTFTWQGIDGSEVLTHFSPARDYAPSANESHDQLPYFTTYNAMIIPSQITGGWQRFQQKGLDNHFLVSYGYGDGGGGPTDWMLENARRMQAPLPATPVVRQQHARPFFEALDARVSDDPRLPKWSGELYLEYHRGTYTAMARNKRENRTAELLLRDLELWRTLAARQAGLAYPQDALDAIWKDVLTLQFHDILPGSSIQKVYEDSKTMYAARFAEIDKLTAEGTQSLTAKAGGDVLAFNSLSHTRDDVIWFDAPNGVTAVRDAAGTLYPVQRVGERACAFVRGLAPMGTTPLWFAKMDAPDGVTIDQHGFETPFYSGTFDAAMRISRLHDKRANREVAKDGETLNRIVCYENKPHNYDAWEMNIYYDRRHWEVDDVESVDVVSAGPVLGQLRVTYRYMASRIEQLVTVYHDLPRIDFETTVDWREVQYLLKAHFPVDVFYTEATYDIQYGNVRRATHKNTTWDVARFEVCAHKWADVSEDGYGVSLLNDCKYGHSIDEDSMALTLLKSSTYPNPTADQEVHYFTYSLLPHVGGWREGGTVDSAYALNVPVNVAPSGGGEGQAASFAAVDAPNVIIEAVKQTQDGDGVIVRMYECHGRRTDATLSLGFAPASAVFCNLLEEKLEPAVVQDRHIPVTLRPYQIVSLRIRS